MRKLFTRHAALPFLCLFICLGGCVTGGEAVTQNTPVEPKLHIYAPEGEVPPAGLEKIELGMTQVQVLRILSPLYKVSHAAAAQENSPGIDSFFYSSGDRILMGEVMYAGPSVFAIRYGYVDDFVVY